MLSLALISDQLIRCLYFHMIIAAARSAAPVAAVGENADDWMAKLTRDFKRKRMNFTVADIKRDFNCVLRKSSHDHWNYVRVCNQTDILREVRDTERAVCSPWIGAIFCYKSCYNYKLNRDDGTGFKCDRYEYLQHKLGAWLTNITLDDLQLNPRCLHRRINGEFSRIPIRIKLRKEMGALPGIPRDVRPMTIPTFERDPGKWLAFYGAPFVFLVMCVMTGLFATGVRRQWKLSETHVGGGHVGRLRHQPPNDKPYVHQISLAVADFFGLTAAIAALNADVLRIQHMLPCRWAHYTSVPGVRLSLSLVNQILLLGLVRDRNVAMSRPMDHRVRSSTRHALKLNALAYLTAGAFVAVFTLSPKTVYVNHRRVGRHYEHLKDQDDYLTRENAVFCRGFHRRSSMYRPSPDKPAGNLHGSFLYPPILYRRLLSTRQNGSAKSKKAKAKKKVFLKYPPVPGEYQVIAGHTADDSYYRLDLRMPCYARFNGVSGLPVSMYIAFSVLLSVALCIEGRRMVRLHWDFQGLLHLLTVFFYCFFAVIFSPFKPRK